MLKGNASKFLVAVLGNAAASLEVYFGSAHWVPVAVAALTTLGVYLVPNANQP